MRGAAPFSAPFSARADGLSLRVRVTPRAGRDRILGVIALPTGPALKVAVAAPAADGRANDAVIALLSKALGVPKSRVTLASGAASRLKTLRVAGDGAQLAARLVALIGAP